MKGAKIMEKYFSLNKIFTESVNYKDYTKPTSQLECVYTAIDQASIITSNESSLDDALYRIKEVEKDISKNTLNSIHAYEIERGLVNGLQESVYSYDYTNLDNTSVPCLDKLDSILSEANDILSNYDKYGTVDAAEDVISFLKEEAAKIDDNYDIIRNDVLGISLDTTITPDNFTEEAFKLFRNGSMLESHIVSEGDFDHYKVSDDFVKKAACDGVECYNNKLIHCIAKLRAVVDLLSKESTNYYNNNEKVDEYKKHLLKKLCKYACKFLAHANIAYAMKADATNEFLHPTANPDVKGFIVRRELPEFDLFDSDDSGDETSVEFESAILESALDDIEITADDYDGIDAVVCGKLESYEIAYANYYINEACSEILLEAEINAQGADALKAAANRMGNAAGGFKTPANNNAAANNNVADAAKQGAEAGKEQVKTAANTDNKDAANNPEDKPGLISTFKNNIVKLFEMMKQFISKMMFRIAKAAGKYSALARNYNADTLYTKYTDAVKNNKFDPNAFKELVFKGNPETAANKIKAFIGNLRQKTARNLIDTKGDQTQYNSDYFWNKITDNANIKDKDSFDADIRGANTDFTVGPNNLTKDMIKLMLDINLSAEMEIGKFSSTVQNMIADGNTWQNTVTLEAYEELTRDEKVRENIGSLLEEYFGKGYKAFAEQDQQAQAQQQQQATANNVANKSQAVINSIKTYVNIFNTATGVVGTIMHQLYAFNDGVLRRIEEDKMTVEQPQQNQNQQAEAPANNEKPAEQQPQANQ